MVVVVMMLRVLVLSPESESPPPRFVQELGIHLSRTAEVVPGPAVTGVTLPAKVESAVGAVDAADAALAVWVERGTPSDDGDLEFVLFVVGRRQGRLLVEVFRVPAREGPDLDRTLALKVGEVLDRALREEGGERAAAQWVGADPEDPLRPTTPRPIERRDRRWLLALDARWGGGVDAPAHQWGVALGGGCRWHRDRFAVEAYGALGFDGGLDEAEDADGMISTDEITALGGARLLSQVGPGWVGAGLGAGVRFVDAEGTTPRGATGTQWVTVPTVTSTAEVRWPAADTVELRAAAGMEWSPDRVTLTVNDQPVVNLGRVRAAGELSLIFLIP